MTVSINGDRLIKYEGAAEHYCVPQHISSIEDLAFSGADSLITLEMPDTVVSIGNYAFMNCYSLEKIRLPKRLEHIGAGLFQNCWKLKELKIPEGVMILGGEMLESCHALTDVYLPDSLKKLERAAFNTCRSLRRIYISPERMEILPTAVRNIAALTYMSTHDGSEPCGIIDDYAKGRQRLLTDLAVNRRDTAAVRYMLRRGIADEDTVRDYLSKSAATNRVEITALLLDHSSKAGRRSEDPVLSEDPFA